MNRMIRTLWAVCAAVIAFGFALHPDRGSGTLKITLLPRFSGEPLVLGNQLYHTQQGDSLYVDMLRFYLSNIQLQGRGTAFSEKNSYHLIDAEESASLTIELKNVPAGNYESLCFYAGTDSLANVSGAMGGDLDPTLGMYWAWNSGYINVKIEGRSNSSPALHHALTFHIGGYMPPNQTVRRIALPLKDIKIAKDKTSTVSIGVDLSKVFNRISIPTTNQIMIPSRAAAQMADYFTGVFSPE